MEIQVREPFSKYDRDNFTDSIVTSTLERKVRRFEKSVFKRIEDIEQESAEEIINSENNWSIDQVVYVGKSGRAIVHWKHCKGRPDEYGLISHRNLRLTGRRYARLLLQDMKEFDIWRPDTWDEFRTQYNTILSVYKHLKAKNKRRPIVRFDFVTNYVDYMCAHVKTCRGRVQYVNAIDLDWFLYFMFSLRRFLRLVEMGRTRIRSARHRSFREKDYYDLIITLDAALFREEFGIQKQD